jgi:hypothetical protein
MSRGARASAVVAACGLLLGCGLPVESGVRSAGPVAPEAVQGGVQEWPAGPPADADARDVVLGFLNAQTSGEDDHALAREFLAPEIRDEWDDSTGVVIYDQTSVDVLSDPDDESVVVFRADQLATIGADGAYLLQDEPIEDVYRLARDERGQLRLVDVPPGLRLTPPRTSGSYRPVEVFYLAPSDGPRPADRLVPDRVFLPVPVEAGALVRALLTGPSAGLGGAVETGFPPGTELRREVEVSDGVVTVDLTGPLGEAGEAQRRQLSAQLVWTLQTELPSTTSVRLLVDGEPLDVPGTDALQDRSDWRAFDPVGPAARTAALYVEERRLRRLDGTTTRSEATDGRLPVDAVASSPSTGRLAVLTRDGSPEGGDVVRIGSPSGPFEPVLELASVRSMSWGSGERGLWVVAGGGEGSADGRILVVPAGTGAEPVEVSYVPPPGAGALSVLKVSRDGVRVAAVFGAGAERRLWLGRVEAGDGTLRLAALRPVAPALSDVVDVTWESGTSLVVLAPLGTPNRLPVRVAIDGSEVEPVRTLGLDGEPESVAAAPGRPLVIGAVLADRRVLLVEDGGLFRLQAGTGREPAYPG